jgi:hypothetical protein
VSLLLLPTSLGMPVESCGALGVYIGALVRLSATCRPPVLLGVRLYGLLGLDVDTSSHIRNAALVLRRVDWRMMAMVTLTASCWKGGANHLASSFFSIAARSPNGPVRSQLKVGPDRSDSGLSWEFGKLEARCSALAYRQLLLCLSALSAQTSYQRPHHHSQLSTLHA